MQTKGVCDNSPHFINFDIYFDIIIQKLPLCEILAPVVYCKQWLELFTG